MCFLKMFASMHVACMKPMSITGTLADLIGLDGPARHQARHCSLEESKQKVAHSCISCYLHKGASEQTNMLWPASSQTQMTSARVPESLTVSTYSRSEVVPDQFHLKQRAST